MRRFRVTVNGQVFEVEVEEIEAAQARLDGSAPAAGNPAPAVKAAAGTLGADVPPTGPAGVGEAAAQGTAIQGAAAQGTAVTAPLPGVVLDVRVRPGQVIEAGDIVCILEAMKMENEIPSPAGGTVVQVLVDKGTSVDLGQVLAVIA